MIGNNDIGIINSYKVVLIVTAIWLIFISKGVVFLNFLGYKVVHGGAARVQTFWAAVAG